MIRMFDTWGNIDIAVECMISTIILIACLTKLFNFSFRINEVHVHTHVINFIQIFVVLNKFFRCDIYFLWSNIIGKYLTILRMSKSYRIMLFSVEKWQYFTQVRNQSLTFYHIENIVNLFILQKAVILNITWRINH